MTVSLLNLSTDANYKTLNELSNVVLHHGSQNSKRLTEKVKHSLN